MSIDPVAARPRHLRAPRDRWTLVHVLRDQALAFGGRPFARFEDGQSFTFGSLDERSDELARGLHRLGVRPGDRVLSLCGNRAEAVVAMFASLKLGAVWVPVNTGLRGAFLQHQLHNAEPRVVLLEDALAKLFDEVGPGPVAPEALIVVGDPATPTPPCFADVPRVAVDQLDTSPADDLDLVTPRPADVAMIMYTSGTTGPSKGVLMPHGHCYVVALGAVEATRLGPDDRYFVCMPFFHANGLLMQFMAALLAGAGVVVVERFRATTWLEEIRAAEATITNGLGVIPEFIFRQPPTDRDQDHQLRLMMAVPIAEEWGEAFEDRFGVPFLQGFGMTECNIVAYTRPEEALVPGCAGYVLEEWFVVRVVDPDTDEPLTAGAVGEIVVRPRLPGCFMGGYFRMPERTVEAWRNLWFHTGDAGRFDGLGRLHYVDRIKDCIRRRGENISSFEIEQVLNSHPAVAESAVVGVKVAGAGGEDEVKAYVVPADGYDRLDPVDLLDWCSPRMPYFAVPRFVEQVVDLAKTATGKLQKVPLREAGVTEGTWDRESVAYVVRR